MKKFKRILGLLIALTMILSILFINAAVIVSAEEEELGAPCSKCGATSTYLRCASLQGYSSSTHVISGGWECERMLQTRYTFFGCNICHYEINVNTHSHDRTHTRCPYEYLCSL